MLTQREAENFVIPTLGQHVVPNNATRIHRKSFIERVKSDLGPAERKKDERRHAFPKGKPGTLKAKTRTKLTHSTSWFPIC